MRQPEWLADPGTRCYAIPEGVVGEAKVTSGECLRWEPNEQPSMGGERGGRWAAITAPTRSAAPYRDAWERLLGQYRKRRDKYFAAFGSAGEPPSTPSDGRFWLVLRREECLGCRAQRKTSTGCSICGETGTLTTHELVAEDAEEVEIRDGGYLDWPKETPGLHFISAEGERWDCRRT